MKAIRTPKVGMSTGIPTIDTDLRGLHGIVGLVGDSKACKSTFALQIAVRHAGLGNPVLYFDHENLDTELRRRLACSLCLTSEGNLKGLSMQSEEKLHNFMANKPFGEIDGQLTPRVLEEAVVDAMNCSEDKKVLLVLDSLHKLPQNMDNIRGSIDGWLIFLEGLKKKYNGRLVIIFTCEKNRGSYGSASQASAKESGRIEYTCDQVFDLYKEQLEDEKQSDTHIMLTCTYNRHGKSGLDIKLLKVSEGPLGDFTYILKEERGLLL
jgi:hypothetical protein